MKEVILKGSLDKTEKLFEYGWQYKKQITGSTTNSIYR